MLVLSDKLNGDNAFGDWGNFEKAIKSRKNYALLNLFADRRDLNVAKFRRSAATTSSSLGVSMSLGT